MIGNNIRKVRLALNMTQQAFAERINLKQGTIASVENNKRNISRQAITAICREFGASENFLLTGEGEMFDEKDDSSLAKLKAAYGLNDNDVVAIKSFLELPPEFRKAVINWGKNFAVNMAAQMGIDLLAETDKADGLTEEEKVSRIIEAEINEVAKLQSKGNTS